MRKKPQIAFVVRFLLFPCYFLLLTIHKTNCSPLFTCVVLSLLVTGKMQWQVVHGLISSPRLQTESGAQHKNWARWKEGQCASILPIDWLSRLVIFSNPCPIFIQLDFSRARNCNFIHNAWHHHRVITGTKLRDRRLKQQAGNQYSHCLASFWLVMMT